jgi:hypothetical protein
MAAEGTPVNKPVFFSGVEALQEVAKPDGLWNWALVGADPDRMPLSGGGAGSIDEMRHALGAQPSSFGLLRMSFGTGAKQKTKYIYVHASNVDDDDTAAFTMRERGQALAKAPLMERAMQKFVQTHVKVEITNKEDCCVAFIIEKLLKVSSVHAAFISEELYAKAMEEFRAAHPVSKEQEAKQAKEVKLIEDLVPAPEQHEPEHEKLENKEEDAEVTRQRKKVRIFKPGDVLMVWSDQSQSWHDDGEVVQVLQEPGRHAKQILNAGCMKVVYANGRRFKWVDPQHAETILRPSSRPLPPPVKSGELEKETHSVFTEWHVRYFELSKGFLTWWKCKEDAARGAPCNNYVPLLGLQLNVEDTMFSFFTPSRKGQLFTLDAGSSAEAEAWAGALSEHGKYMERLKEHLSNVASQQAVDQVLQQGQHQRGLHHRHH